MRRAPFTVVILPYAVELDGEISYAVLRGASRRDVAWHALAGEGVRGETPLEAARREAWRFAAIPPDAAYLALDTRPAIGLQGEDPAIDEHAFAVRICEHELCPRRGRLEHHWVSYEIAQGLLVSQTDRDVLWELRRRLGRPASCF